MTLRRDDLRRVDPLIEPRFFASRPLAPATVIAVAAFTAFGGFLFLKADTSLGDCWPRTVCSG